jgi:hypothetical protein
MANQAVRGLNCPHCGEIIKAICPEMNKEPRKVEARKVSPLFNINACWSSTACKYCSKEVWVLWSF